MVSFSKYTNQESVSFVQLREHCAILRNEDGMRACRSNPVAVGVLRSAVQKAIDDKDWRELWVLLAQIRRWLEVMNIAGANACWPFWLVQSDESRSGDTLGTALHVQDVEYIALEGDMVTPVKEEQRAELPDGRSRAQEEQAQATHQHGARLRREVSRQSELTLDEFPVGSAVLTPRYDGGEYYSYCTVLAHREGRLRVDIPGEAPFNLSLSSLQRTGDKYSQPLCIKSAPPAEAETELRPNDPISPPLLATALTPAPAPMPAPTPAPVELDTDATTDSPAKRQRVDSPSTLAQPIRVKLESDARGLEAQRSGQRNEDPHTKENEKIREQFLTEPETGQPRHTFRKGTSGAVIATVLGGNPMEAWPIVKTAGQKGFVKAGEMYYAGNRPFNPLGPSYAGGPGLLQVQCFPESQEELIVFGQVRQSPINSLSACLTCACVFWQCSHLDKSIDPPQPRHPVTSWHGEACAGKFRSLRCVRARRERALNVHDL